MRLAVIVLLLLPNVAHADHGGDGDLANVLVGPLFGIRLSGPPGSRAIIGLEGGVGYGPERLNLGFEHRSDHDLAYISVDPWYIVGGSFGFGVDETGKAHGLIGVWEGLPVIGNDAGCDAWHTSVTIAGGYRYMGEHTLYLTMKAGYMRGNVCF